MSWKEQIVNSQRKKNTKFTNGYIAGGAFFCPIAHYSIPETSDGFSLNLESVFKSREFYFLYASVNSLDAE
jgi:hypothetical protein